MIRSSVKKLWRNFAQEAVLLCPLRSACVSNALVAATRSATESIHIEMILVPATLTRQANARDHRLPLQRAGLANAQRSLAA
jgi:hypothetical protein